MGFDPRREDRRALKARREKRFAANASRRRHERGFDEENGCEDCCEQDQPRFISIDLIVLSEKNRAALARDRGQIEEMREY